MADRLSVCNDALVLLGQVPLSSLTDVSDRSLIINTIYDRVLDGLIRNYYWDCCVKRVTLAPLANAQAFLFDVESNAFQMPSDCLRVVSISLDDTDQEYVVEDGKIITDAAVVYLRYQYRKDEGWDAGFTESLVYSLAAALAYPLTMAADKAQYMEQLASDKIRKARLIDAQQGTVMPIRDSAVLRARYG